MTSDRFETSTPAPGLTDVPPLGMDATSLARAFRHYYTHNLGRDRYCRLTHYAYEALALVVRDRLMERWKMTRYAYTDSYCRQAYYLSLEFLMGRALGNSILNLGLDDEVTKALAKICLVGNVAVEMIVSNI